MDTTWRDKLLVASIDFGTTYSGFAVSFKHDYTPENPVILTHDWKSGETPGTLKTPTCVLLNPDKNFHSFGYEAETKYASLAEDDMHEGWHLFRRFKMLLYKDKGMRGLKMTDTIEDTKGREFPAIRIFTHAINYMKTKIIAFVKDRIPEIKENDMYYVLTTPAIWSEQAKAFMRTAARNAGIKDDHLRIALEPECAAVYLHKTDIPVLNQTSSTKTVMKPGSCHVIVDAGGGTIDIAAHRVGDNGKFEEVIPPCGGPWGSDNINSEFENFLIKMSGRQVLDLFKTENMDDFLFIQRTFEYKKCAFTEHDEEMSKVIITVPQSFRELHESRNYEDMSSSVKKKDDISKYVEFKRDKMKIGHNLFMQFYEPAIGGVMKTIEEALRHIKCKIDTLYCVGGFSDSYMLRKAIKDRFRDMTVVIPSNAISAVMKGAVIFGRDQSIVNKRISPYTIGLDCHELFDSRKHPLHKREETEDGNLCTDIFKILIRKDELIQYDAASKEVDAYPKCKYETDLNFSFYRSDIAKEPMFVTDAGCHHIGSMKINISEDFHAAQQNNHITLKVFFGATELRAEATDENGRNHEVVFSYGETQV